MVHLRSAGKFVFQAILVVGVLCCIVSSKSSTKNNSSIAPSISIAGSQEGPEQNVSLVVNDVDEGTSQNSSKTNRTDPVEEADTNEVKCQNTKMDVIDDKRSRKRAQFLNRIATVSSMLLRQEEATLVEENDFCTDEAEKVTPQSDLSRPGRHIHIVTTASLPWFTGTAVNPLLRAAYLHDRMELINSGQNNSTKEIKSWVTLVIPWLELDEDQRKVYNDRVFESPEEQEELVRDWLRTQAKMPNAADNLNIVFYNARYHAGLGSVFAMGDIIKQLPQDELDVCILEEPEHVNWFRAPGTGWTKQYEYVIGIIHTNYFEYATKHYSGLWTAPAIRIISAAMIRAYCHKVIKLSDVLQPFAPEKEVTENVHGVRQEFIQERQERTQDESIVNANSNGTPQAYFIGKLLWTKGLDLLLDLQEYYKQTTGDYFQMDIYGSGPDQRNIARAYHGRSPRTQKRDRRKKLSKSILVRTFAWANRRRTKKQNLVEESSSKFRDSLEKLGKDLAKAKSSMERFPARARYSIEQLADDFANLKFEASKIPKTLHEFRRNPIPVTFPGRVDHAELKDSYKVFINPSLSEVLCTTTFEALAMGKFAIIPVHPSNHFFMKFPNCLPYRDPYEFVANLQWALTHEPEPLSEELARDFSWEAATDRLLSAAAITHQEARQRELLGKSKVDERIEWLWNELGKGTKGDVIRKVLGGGPVSHQVKYESSKRREQNGESEDEEDEDEGLSNKFQDSAFVQAIRQATANSINAVS
eukprot:scaffold4062_cov137-Cylindrotheca_fusiformis.AAC.6